MSERLNHLGVDRLRRGRVSIPGARYFTTICTEDRTVGLCEPDVASVLIAELQKLDGNGDLRLLAATVMPEHVHFLFILGNRLSLSQVHAKYKVKTRRALSRAGLMWQDNFFDHRLRYQVFFERFVRYIFLNPYVKGLVPLHEVWPYWVLSDAYTPEFMLSLENGVSPPVEWLQGMNGAMRLIDEDMGVE
jgi:REP element-mobilizing transposase RayT